MVDRRAKAIANLQQYRDEHTHAKIIFFPTNAFPQAQAIDAIFRLAGWSTTFNQTAQEDFIHQYFEGIEISGCNSVLLTAIQDSLAEAGYPNLRTTVIEHEVQPENPKYPYAEKSIRVTIGHPPPTATAALEREELPRVPQLSRKPRTRRQLLKYGVFSVAYSLPVLVFDFFNFQEKYDAWTFPAFLGTGSTCLIGFTLMVGGLSDLWFDFFHKGGEPSTSHIINNVLCGLSGLFTVIVYALIQQRGLLQPEELPNWSTHPVLTLLAIALGGIAGVASVIAASLSWRWHSGA
ncbi:hypothetical protein [Nonomuraea sp. NPDC049709]|uniref:hypothetical protein n=1 Tax=Nonomuraea sp. NPDC049709 TaxID=3154736 RepID=UPI003426729E